MSQASSFVLRHATLFFLAGVLAYGLVDAAFDYRSVVSIVEGKAHPPNPNAESDLVVEWRVEWLRLCSAESRRVLMDAGGHRYILEPSEIVAPAHIGIDRFRTTIHIPKGVTAGEAFYTAQWVFRCSWHQQMFVPLIVYPPPVRIWVDGPEAEPRPQEVPPGRE